MSDRPDDESTVLDWITKVIPWVGGAVVLLLIAGIIRASLPSHDTLPSGDVPITANKPIAPAANSSTTDAMAIAPQQQAATVAASDPAENPTASTPPVDSVASQATDSSARSSSYDSGSRGGEVHVRGYTRKDGTYVQPYTRRAPSSGGGGRRGR